jgi:hypothetical protein
MRNIVSTAKYVNVSVFTAKLIIILSHYTAYFSAKIEMSHKIGIRKGLPALSHTSQRTEGFQGLLPLGAQRNHNSISQIPKRTNK